MRAEPVVPSQSTPKTVNSVSSRRSPSCSGAAAEPNVGRADPGLAYRGGAAPKGGDPRPAASRRQRKQCVAPLSNRHMTRRRTPPTVTQP